ncbi:carbohydrate kinase family protein [Candidatus Poriferisodalis sp.]|uniref:carbohydrate kinase family protein n=1 Tax=Candidatus Poriferisodalis sp. TaxID=3101277 RepID=UPI003B027045
MIVCCGEALVDVLDGDESRAVPGGGPMNAAIAAARLGAPSAFVGRVSTDGAGQLIWRHLQGSGVDLRACERGAEPTARAIISLTPHPSFRFEGDSTADTALEAADLTVLDEGSHILHGGTLGMFRGRTAGVLASLAERHDGLVSLDPNVRPAIIEDRDRWDRFHQRWLHSADLYRASDEDLEWIWPRRAAEDCAAELLAGHVATVIVTRGKGCVTVFTAEGQLDVTAPQVDVVDTVGAGDSFVGTVLASLWELLGADRTAFAALELGQWRDIAERAAAAAALTCTRAGADPPTARALETAVTAHRSGG